MVLCGFIGTILGEWWDKIWIDLPSRTELDMEASWESQQKIGGFPMWLGLGPLKVVLWWEGTSPESICENELKSSQFLHGDIGKHRTCRSLRFKDIFLYFRRGNQNLLLNSGVPTFLDLACVTSYKNRIASLRCSTNATGDLFTQIQTP